MFARERIKLSLILLIGLFLLVVPVFAEGNLGTAGANLNTAAGKAGVMGLKDLGSITGKIINVALGLVGLIFMVLMVYAGFLWMTARGAEEQVKKSQDIIIAAVIGLVITLSAYAISALITGKFSEGVGDPPVVASQCSASDALVTKCNSITENVDCNDQCACNKDSACYWNGRMGDCFPKALVECGELKTSTECNAQQNKCQWLL